MMKVFEENSIKKRIALSESREVVLIDCKLATQCEPSQNLFCLTAKGDVLWQIQPSVISHGVIGYSDVLLGQNGELLAYSANGVEYTIEENSGKILSKDLIR